MADTIRIRLVWAASILGLSLVLVAMIAGGVVMETKASGKTIHVKGYAEKRITSDFGIWRGVVATRAAALPPAYQALEQETQKVLAFLQTKGVARDRTDLSPVSFTLRQKRDERGNETSVVEAYEVQQTVTVQLPDVRLIDALSRDSSALIRDGVEFRSFPPEYYYTNLESLKVEMLGAATRDARRRAQTIVSAGGAKLGQLRSAQQGVFQITPVYSTDVSGCGTLDTSAIEKTIKGIVDAEFSLK